MRILLTTVLTALLGLRSLPAALGPALEAARLSTASAAPLRLVAILQPWRQGLWEEIGQRDLQAGNTEGAIHAFEQAQELAQLSPRGQFSLGQAYRMTGKLAEAEQIWQELLEHRQPPPETFPHLFALQRQLGDLAAARRTLEAWYAAQPQDPQVAFQLGLFLLVAQPKRAEELLETAQSADPARSAQVQRLKGALYLAGKAEEEGQHLLILGRALANLSQWDLALAAFEAAVREAPASAEAWAFLGEARQQTGLEGGEALRRAQELDPRSLIVQALLALYWRRQGQPELALAYLYQVASQEPDQPIWQAELGNTLVERGDLEGAAARFQRAIALQPENSRYWQLLGRFCVTHAYQVREMGLPAARQAVILSPDDPAALDLMGWTLLNLQDLPTSERFLQLALSKDAGYASAHLHLGQLYLESGQSGRAYYHLSLAAQLAGERDAVGQAARRLLDRFANSGN